MMATSITRAKSDSAIGHRRLLLSLAKNKRNNTSSSLKRLRWTAFTEPIANQVKAGTSIEAVSKLKNCSAFFDTNYPAIIICVVLLFSGLGDLVLTTFFISHLSANNGHFTVHLFGSVVGSAGYEFRFNSKFLGIALLCLGGALCCIVEASYLIKHNFLAPSKATITQPNQKLTVLLAFTIVPLVFASAGLWLQPRLPAMLAEIVIKIPKSSQQMFNTQMAIEMISLCISLQIFKITLMTLLPLPLVFYKLGRSQCFKTGDVSEAKAIGEQRDILYNSKTFPRQVQQIRRESFV